MTLRRNAGFYILVIMKKIDVDLIKQFKNSLADVKAGKIKRVG
jgi:hypothetical protein